MPPLIKNMLELGFIFLPFIVKVPSNKAVPNSNARFWWLSLMLCDNPKE